MSETKTDTKVEQVTVHDLDNLLGTPGGDDVITDPNADQAPTFFQKDQVDMAVLDEPPTDPPADEDNDLPADPPADPPADQDDPPADPNTTSFDDLVDDPADPSKKGRPPLDKDGMVQLVEGLIKSEKLIPFEDDKPLTEYTQKDFEELIEANIAEREKKIRQETPAEFFDSLPSELQYAAKYVADGGRDLRGLFAALARVEDNKSLTPENESHQETIVRNYLSAKQFGTAEEIQEEIDSYKDLDKLEAKAKQFKPKLDKMNEEIVRRQVAEQDAKRKQQEQASMNYMNSVYEVLREGDLNGIKLNNKTQNMLYQGLTQPNYPSTSGRATNLLGHLLEKHQFVEPNHALVAEALWLLQDPEGYKSEITKTVKNDVVGDTVKKLKTEQSNKTASDTGDPDTGGGSKKKGLAKPNPDFFRRSS